MTKLARTSVEWAIEHFIHQGDKDIFPKTFEYDALYFAKDDVIDFICSQDITSWEPRALRRCLVPKQRYGFRNATQLDPLDMIFYTTLILETGDSIEAIRVPAHENVAFSYRFARDDVEYAIFDKDYRYEEFQQHSSRLASSHRFVVVTDIADFFPRIYLHRIENALEEALRSQIHHARSLVNLIKRWNHNVSYGIPVGNNPSRLIAELVIDDIDRILLTERVKFTRYVDDYRLFANTHEEAYQLLTRLASLLYDLHGLTLHAAKTKILPTEQFANIYLESEEKRELHSLATRFNEIMSELGLEDPYEPVDYDDLPLSVQEEIDKLNLENLLEEQLSVDEIDIPMMRFLIKRFSTLGNTSVLRPLLNNTDKLYPVFQDILAYLTTICDDIPAGSRVRVGKYLLNQLSNSVVGQLDYHRMLIAHLFAINSQWGNGNDLPGLYTKYPGDWFRSEILQGIGKQGLVPWLRSKKNDIWNMPPWERRAYVYATSCLPKDELKHYYKTIRPRLDRMEQIILDWAHKYPINVR